MAYKDPVLRASCSGFYTFGFKMSPFLWFCGIFDSKVGNSKILEKI